MNPKLLTISIALHLVQYLLKGEMCHTKEKNICDGISDVISMRMWFQERKKFR